MTAHTCCTDQPTTARLWHGAYCRWYDHRDAGHTLRAAAWGLIADRLANHA